MAKPIIRTDAQMGRECPPNRRTIRLEQTPIPGPVGVITTIFLAVVMCMLLGCQGTSVPTPTMARATTIPTPPQNTPTPSLESYLASNDPSGLYIQADGSDEKTYLTHESATEPAWSPNGQIIAFMCEATNLYGWEVCLINRDGTDKRYATSGTKVSKSPHWLRDGTSLYVASYREESTDIWLLNLNDNTWVNITPSTPGSHEHYPRLMAGSERLSYISEPGSGGPMYSSNLDGSDAQLVKGSVTVVDQSYYPWRTKTFTR